GASPAARARRLGPRRANLSRADGRAARHGPLAGAGRRRAVGRGLGRAPPARAVDRRRRGPGLSPRSATASEPARCSFLQGLRGNLLHRVAGSRRARRERAASVQTGTAWQTPPAPPAGFIGDPAVLHTITGSPCGTNFFRVEGPGLPHGGVETNLWSVLGKKVSVCGNGMVEPGEQCDDGNTVDGDCCSSTCQFEPAGAPCGSPTACLTATMCDR